MIAAAAGGGVLAWRRTSARLSASSQSSTSNRTTIKAAAIANTMAPNPTTLPSTPTENCAAIQAPEVLTADLADLRG